MTDDRMNLESYLLDIHRRGREESERALPSHAADDILLSAYALYPGERFGRDLALDERRSPDGRLGALRVTPENPPSEELTHLLLDAMAQVQIRRESLGLEASLAEFNGTGDYDPRASASDSATMEEDAEEESD